MTSQFRIGFIGSGGIAQYHFQNLLGIRNARVVALADVNPESISRLKARFPEAAECEEFQDWRAMLRKVKLDAVQIHTPHTLHYDQIVAALKRGLHVLVEKPMVSRVDHAKKVCALAQASGKVVTVSYNRHFDPMYRWVKKALGDEKLGPLHFISATQWQCWADWAHTWRGQPELSGGGMLNDTGSHMVDIILWTSGIRPTEVFAHINNYGTKVDVLTSASVRCTQGILFNLAVVGRAIGFDEDVSFFCRDGQILIRSQQLKVVRSDGKVLTPVTSSQKPADANWIAAIQGKAENLAPPEVGLRTIYLTQALWDSAFAGQPKKIRWVV